MSGTRQDQNGDGSSQLELTQRIDEACDRFEAAWKAGRNPRIENYLGAVPEAGRAELLRHLLALELLYRRRHGEHAAVAEYLARFPDAEATIAAVFAQSPPRPWRETPRAGPMGAESADRNLLFGVLALQNNFIDRTALLAAFNAWVADKSRPLGRVLVVQGALDESRHNLLNALVREHLRLHDDDPEKSLADLSSVGSVRRDLEDLADPDLAARLGHIGAARSGERDTESTVTYVGAPAAPGLRFHILRPHAQGGLGQVSVALDEELHREVALKEIQPHHADEPHSRARFVQEAEITGGLEHPGIVPVYSLGHDGRGRPFYTMRFVKGDSLRETVKRFHEADQGPSRDPGERSLALRRLLGRFLDVCNAIEYAHSRGVLHRDLKPGNILLGPYGETLVVDWGLAKVVGRPQPRPPEGEPTLRPFSTSAVESTLPGQTLGTPGYMSPEQAAGDLDRLGPRSDVFSLGATLYHLLTGRPPFADSPDCGAVLERTQRCDFPPPRAVARHVPAALEAICLKAMALLPEDRYATTRHLAVDVEHWMADEPITVFREPATARAWRWVRRHRSLVGSVTVLVVTALTATSIGLLLINQERLRTASQRDRAVGAELQARANLRRAQDEEKNARRSEAEARSVLGFLQKRVLAAARPEREKGGLGKDVSLHAAIDAAEPAIAADFPDQPVVEAAVRSVLGESYRYLGDYGQAIRQQDRARALLTKTLGPGHPATVESVNNLAIAYRNAGQLTEAVTLGEEVVRLRKAARGPGDPETLSGMSNLVGDYWSAGRIADAIALGEEVVRLRKSTLGESHPQTLHSAHNLALAYQSAGRRREALALLEDVLRRDKEVLGPDHPETLRSLNSLTLAYRDAGRTAEAISVRESALPLYEKTLGSDHPDTLACLSNLAGAYRETGRFADAVSLYRKTLGLMKAKLGPDHPDTLRTMGGLANSLWSDRRIDEAIGLHEESLRLRKQRFGSDHPDTLNGINNLAIAYNAAGRTDEAITQYEQAVKLMTAKLGPGHPDTLACRSNLAGAYLTAGRADDAVKLLEEVVPLRKAKLGPDHPGTLRSMNALVGAYLDAGRTKEGIALAEDTVRRYKSKLGPDHIDTLKSRGTLALAYRAAGRADDAVRLLEDVLPARKAKLGPDHPDTLRGMSDLALAYVDARRTKEAIALGEELLKIRGVKLGPGHEDTLVAKQDLANTYLTAGRWADAELLLRAVRGGREKSSPGQWRTFLASTQLGSALAGLKRYDEAESLLIRGYEGLKAREAKIAAPNKKHLTEAAERIVRLYEAWGKPDQAAAWRKRLGNEPQPRRRSREEFRGRNA